MGGRSPLKGVPNGVLKQNSPEQLWVKTKLVVHRALAGEDQGCQGCS